MKVTIRQSGDLSDDTYKEKILSETKERLQHNIPDKLTGILTNATQGKWSYTEGIFADPRYIRSGYVDLSEYWDVKHRPTSGENVVSFYILNNQPYFKVTADPGRIKNTKLGRPPTFPAGNEAHYLYRGSSLPRAPNPNIYPVAKRLMYFVNGKKKLAKAMPPRQPNMKFINTVKGSVNRSISEVMQYGRL